MIVLHLITIKVEHPDYATLDNHYEKLFIVPGFDQADSTWQERLQKIKDRRSQYADHIPENEVVTHLDSFAQEEDIPCSIVRSHVSV